MISRIFPVILNFSVILSFPVILSAAKNLTLGVRETLRMAQGDKFFVRLAHGDRLLVLLAFLVAACAGASAPDWVSGMRASAYPDDQYLIGVGQADSRNVAEERAYAALARIFKADIVSESKDSETYLNLERKGFIQTERRLAIETLTKVTTDKLLENVRIAETWRDPKTGLYSALTVLHRSAAQSMLSRRIAELDTAIISDERGSAATADKLLKLRGLRRALRNLIARETLNRDLQIISGRAIAPPFSVSDLMRDFEKFLSESVVVAVEVQGDQAPAVRQAIIESLIRAGLPVSARDQQEALPDLIIKGETRLWAADLPDPKFRYVRWCADFIMLSPATHHIVGGIARAGREGHLNYPEAFHRSLLTLQQELSAALTKAFAEQIFGDAATDQAPLPAACSKAPAG
jgi:LPP20 lipoprotein